jgi:hypothetical protein
MRDSQLLHVVDLRHMEEVGSLIKRGDGKLESINVAKILKVDTTNMFWVYDITLRKLMKFNFINYLKKGTNQPDTILLLKDSAANAMSPTWMSDSCFVSSSYDFCKFRLFYFNGSSRILNKVGGLPPRLRGWPKESISSVFKHLSIIYKIDISKRPNENRLVVTYRNFPQIEIYKKGELDKIIRGPMLFYPNPYFGKDPSGNIIEIPNYQTMHAFSNLRATKCHFYVLFLGNDTPNMAGNKILIFDWNGRPVHYVHLNIGINKFAVEEINNKITFFIIDPADRELKYFSINI